MPLVDAVETDTHPTAVKVPQDGDKVDAITVASGMTALASRTNHLHLHALQDDFAAGVSGAATNIYTIPAGDVLRSVSSGAIRPSFLQVTGKIQNYSDPTFAATTPLDIDGPWNQKGDWTREGKLLRFGTSARTRYRRLLHGTTDSDITVAHDYHRLPNNIVANRVRTVKTSGTLGGVDITPEDCEIITIVRTHPSVMAANTETIVSQSGQTLFVFGTGNCGAIMLMFDADAADWIPVHGHQYDIASSGHGFYGG